MFMPPSYAKTNLPLKRFELLVSFIFVIIVLTIALKHAIAISSSNDSSIISGLTQSPYFSSTLIDLHDGQLKTFIKDFSDLVITCIIFLILRKGLFAYYKSSQYNIYFYAIFGLVLCIYLHGDGVIFTVIYIGGNYFLSKNFAGLKFFPAFLWAGNLAFLILSRFYDGFSLTWLFSILGITRKFPLSMKWYRVHNLCFLKVISFCMDYHWNVSKKIIHVYEKHMINCVECTKGVKCLKFRTETHADNYDFITFFAYVCYFPLYFAGPIMTYNSWLSQVLSPQQSYDKKRLCIYAFRWIVIFGLLLWFIHNLYLPAIANSQYNRHLLFWLNCSELLTVSFFVLKWMWLKFTVIWRFFRIVALLDGIECPENMITCMSNNYCFEGFWRAWHHSFNLWLVRYLFIPLGGKHTKIYNIWIVYGFVGLWHDVSLDMVFWSWGMCLFIVPELLIKSYFSHEKFNAFRNTLVYSWLCVLGSVFCIFLMITANLVGFSYGSEGITPIVRKFISIEGLKAIFRGMIFLTIATHFNRLYREEETRRGIKKKY